MLPSPSCVPTLKKLAITILTAISLSVGTAFGQTLKIVTMNIWTGLDYVGKYSIGEYEPKAVRDQRTHLLIAGLRRIRPDVVALQEVNPVSTLGPAIAAELGYDCICERANAGMKIGGIGLPTNLNEGLVILARKSLHLQFADVWNLSDGFGFFGNAASFHLSERRLALVGKIRIGNAELYVANAHLSSVVPDDSSTRRAAFQIASSRSRNEPSIQAMVSDCFSDADNRLRSTELLLEQLNGAYADKPLILLGDFNAPSSASEITRLKSEGVLIETAEVDGIAGSVTWDPERNTNIRYSTQSVDARGDSLNVYGLLSSWYDGHPRTIDHVFLSKHWLPADVLEARIILDKPENGLFASDHYGFLTTVDMGRIVGTSTASPDEVPLLTENELEGLPIISYDTDTGFGYGVKGFLLNYLGMTESFDITAFNSTKGERWYRFVFSVPDFEMRQGKIYPLSFDLSMDYDKYLKNNFYGVGNASSLSNFETYTKEPLDITGVLSRGFTREVVAQLGLKYRTVRNFDYDPSLLFAQSLPAINHGRSSALTIYGGLRYDSRDSFVNPSRGEVAEVTLETGGSWLTGDYTLTSKTFALQTYKVLFYPKTVFAAKLWGQSVEGTNLPVHVLASVGGNRTLRGSPQDRFLNKTAVGFNGEVRFPVYRRLGGIVGIDAARVFDSPSGVTLFNWAYNPVAGLRLYMDTFVVRADVGFGKETTGFYLNFGQIF